MQHHCLWQVELLQLLQDGNTLCFRVLEEALGDDGVQEAEGLHSVDCGTGAHGPGVRGMCSQLYMQPPVI